MLTIRLVPDLGDADALVLLARTAPAGGAPVVLAEHPGVPDDVRAEVTELVRDATTDVPGTVWELPRPLRRPSRVLVVSLGTGGGTGGGGTGTGGTEGRDGGEAGWRAAGAALARSGTGPDTVVALPPGSGPPAVRGLAEGLWLASCPDGGLAAGTGAPAGTPPGQLRFAVHDPTRSQPALDAARVTAQSTWLARQLTNAPSSLKSPGWLADRMAAAAAGLVDVTVTVRGPVELAAEGFGGLVAVGAGSATGPRLLELDYRPPGSTRHVVLVGKGITFDTGGICIKPRDAMKLMRKDMGGAASVVAATVGAARLRLPVRVTALAALAENMVSGSAFRPGDVIRLYDGSTSESTNTDAEGRLVLADALAYGAGLQPDLLVDLATLTGANAIALGKQTAALYTDNDELAARFAAAADQAGEQLWRMPLPADYLEYLASDIADRHSSPDRGAGSVVAALYLREFTGALRDRWLHLDMSAPSWTDAADGELTSGATGWGVRTLLRWLANGDD